jgi:hypothetical protein
MHALKYLMTVDCIMRVGRASIQNFQNQLKVYWVTYSVCLSVHSFIQFAREP